MPRGSVERYNERMRRIWDEARVQHIRCAPLHQYQMLKQLTDQLEAIEARRQDGGVSDEDWSDLHRLVRAARSVLDRSLPEITRHWEHADA